MLLLLSGLPGSGKSTLARAYVARYGGVHLNSDILRAELGLRGQYQTGDKERVYAAMLAKTRQVLEAGSDAVVDSTFYRESIRAPFEALAAELHVPVARVEVRASPETIRQRLQTPRADSEADFGVYEKIRDQYEPSREPQLELWSDALPLYQLLEMLHHYLNAGHDH